MKLSLPETNIAHENPIFPGKYHQNGGFSMAMLVSGSVSLQDTTKDTPKRYPFGSRGSILIVIQGTPKLRFLTHRLCDGEKNYRSTR